MRLPVLCGETQGQAGLISRRGSVQLRPPQPIPAELAVLVHAPVRKTGYRGAIPRLGTRSRPWPIGNGPILPSWCSEFDSLRTLQVIPIDRASERSRLLSGKRLGRYQGWEPFQCGCVLANNTDSKPVKESSILLHPRQVMCREPGSPGIGLQNRESECDPLATLQLMVA